MVKEEHESIEWKAECIGAKSKEVLCLIKEYGLKTVIFCRGERECTSLAGQISVLYTGLTVKVITQGLTEEETEKALKSIDISKDGIIVTTSDTAESLDFRIKDLGLVINTALPSTAKEYTLLIRKLLQDRKLTAILLWNYNDIIDGSDFIFDIAESSGQEAPDLKLALRFIKECNRLYKRDTLCRNLIGFLNREYGKKGLYGIWTYTDTRELFDLLIKEEKIKICRWPFSGRIGICPKPQEQRHLRLLHLHRPSWLPPF